MSQGQTFPEYLLVDIGDVEKSAGQSYVAMSRSKEAMLFAMIAYSKMRLNHPRSSPVVISRIREEARLATLAAATLQHYLDHGIGYV